MVMAMIGADPAVHEPLAVVDWPTVIVAGVMVTGVHVGPCARANADSRHRNISQENLRIISSRVARIAFIKTIPDWRPSNVDRRVLDPAARGNRQLSRLDATPGR